MNIAQELFHKFASYDSVNLATKLRTTYFENKFYIVHAFSDGSALIVNKADGAISVCQDEIEGLI